MEFLTDALLKLEQFKKLNSALKRNVTVAASGLSQVHKANIISSLCHLNNVRAFCVASDEQEAQRLCNDLCSMGRKAFVFPAKDFIFRDVSGRSHEYEHQRLNVLLKMLSGDYDVIIGCIDGACQYTIPPEKLKSAELTLSQGLSVPLEKCVKTLTLLGYERYDQVDGCGQFAVRGGILDFFMPDSENPVRAEFWGDEIDSLNYFDIETQRRTEPAEKIILSPSSEIIIEDKTSLAEKIEKKASLLRSKNAQKAKEILYREAELLRSGAVLSNIDKFIGLVYEKPATVFDYLDKNSLIFVSEHIKVNERVKACNFQYEQDMKDYFADGILCRGFDTFSIPFTDFEELLKTHRSIFIENFLQSGISVPIDDIFNFTAKQSSPWNGSLSVLCEDLASIVTDKSCVVILSGTEKAAANLADNLNEKGYKAQLITHLEKITKGALYVMAGTLSAGLEYPGADFYLISHSLTTYVPKKSRKRNKNSQEIYSLSELTVGDYVVHSTHGIGLYGGIKKLEIQGVTKDYIKIEYAKGDLLYVPVTQLDLVAKYIGPRDNTHIKLNRLGSGDWQKSKTRVKSSVKDIAKELIALYAQRMREKGFAFSGDTEWQHDFECSFEFEETPDQLRCIEEIKSDMQRPVPMDRLLCGDVGFGKTEVALRAAFKCVTDSKQCALLCPTTILAWQHYQTVCRRFDSYPIRVEVLSRFRSAKQQKEIIKKLKQGEIDMIVGTHRLVQKDIEFRDLGLVIIDEEQRFGVAQKEHLKELRKNVDVLTLSATPIPRTLNMALSGIRDMSVIEEAPQNRHPVQSYVLEHDTAVINEAIRRELRRGGQVFYLHNDVASIQSCASRIQQAIPEASIGIGHGKMTESELSDVWRQMLEQEINVFVCTTIIETGIDIPNANTLIIENADKMGLSQLHQLRGRVGRSARRAYAYFTFPKGKVLSDISQKRLTAIREFTEFGSGFKIAMRDLELRGAGNIIGAQQHGQMQDVGYDMYLKLLNDAVAEEKGEKTTATDNDCLIDIAVEAHIPESYIENTSQRLDVYRRIADIRTKEDSVDVIDELIDRFGEVPPSVLGLIDIALVRNKASSAGIYEIRQSDTSMLLYLNDAKSAAAGEIISKFKGNALLSAAKKPYIAVKFPKTIKPLEALKQIFE